MGNTKCHIVRHASESHPDDMVDGDCIKCNGGGQGTAAEEDHLEHYYRYSSTLIRESSQIECVIKIFQRITDILVNRIVLQI